MLEELYEEETSHIADLLSNPPGLTETEVRSLLIAIRQQEREIERLKEIRAAIHDRYDWRIDHHQEAIDRLRSSVQTWIETTNEGRPVKFPDAGGASVRKTQPRVEIDDPEKFRLYATEVGCIKTEADIAAAKKEAIARFKRTGELPHGGSIVPAGTTLVIRKA